MKIEMSSAEFDINSNIMRDLFGNHLNNRYVLAYDDIDKLQAWNSYKTEIKDCYNKDSIVLRQDIHGQYWVLIGGTGWCYGWTVNLGEYKIK